MLSLIGTTPAGFIVITLLLGGGCAFMTGQALANTWRPLWQALAYALLMGVADRFLVFALFGGQLLSPLGYLVDTAILEALATAAYLATRARRMVRQYPWRYERVGLFRWRERPGAEPPRAV